MIHIIKTSLFLLAFLLPTIAFAHDFEIDGIYYNINGNEVSVTYQGTSSNEYSNEYRGTVTIPSSITYGGTTYSVTAIGDMAFEYCNSPMRVTIPNSVTYIGYRAFNRCYNLWSVTIPNSVTYIGNYAFMGCSGLTSITLPNSITRIGDHTFWYCTGLISVTIPNSVTYIDANSFYGCSSMADVTIPNSVIYIGDKAFCCCSSLKSIDIPRSVTYIGDDAFMGCTNLNNVTVANGNTKYDSRSSCNAIIETSNNKLIYGCKNTSIPNTITSIGDKAFYYCSYLTEITIPNSVSYIGIYAFAYCSTLKIITIGNSVSSIGNYAFQNCNNLSEVFCLAMIPPTIYKNTFSDSYEATLHVPEESVSEYKSANYWSNFSNVQCIADIFEEDGIYYHILADNTVKVIANPSEENYYRGDVVIPDRVTYCDLPYNVTYIDANAFDGCDELTSVVIGDAVETIGKEAFQGCTGLTSVTIGNEVTNIGERAFNYCNALQAVKCLGMVPPAMASSNCFSSAAYRNATLKVHRNYLDTYTSTDYWYKFEHNEGYGSAGLGDADGDGEINIADVTTLIDRLLNPNSDDEFYFESADLNYNGHLDIGDVVTLIDLLLNN